MASIEGRRVDDYGLPRNQAFGKFFWVGAGWGLAAITFLLFVLRGAHVFYFGHVVLRGGRVLKFAVFWMVFFLLVALFEDFLTRGYLLFTLKQDLGFWPAAGLLSCAFGAIHLRNPGETPVGILAAAAIGFFFCFTLRRTGSLWFAVGFHAAWDWGQFLFVGCSRQWVHGAGSPVRTICPRPARLADRWQRGAGGERAVPGPGRRALGPVCPKVSGGEIRRLNSP